MHFIDNWLEENIDEIYESFKETEVFKSLPTNNLIKDPT
jgi:hypothetical protein